MVKINEIESSLEEAVFIDADELINSSEKYQVFAQNNKSENWCIIYGKSDTYLDIVGKPDPAEKEIVWEAIPNLIKRIEKMLYCIVNVKTYFY
jgi:hypothetical protein